MSDIFTSRNLHPMLIADSVPPFDDPAWIYEVKWDGERCIAYLDPMKINGTELRNKRNRTLLFQVPELSTIHKQVKKPCVLDGELIAVKAGKPSFYEIQRRTMMHNPLRISLAGKQGPASFVAFDCIWLDGRDLMTTPLLERKAALQRNVMENKRIAVSRAFAGTGTALYELVKEQKLEGIVAKKADSLYYPGKRTKDWKKIKYLLDDDYVICGYIRKKGHMTSLIIAQYDKENILRYKGHVSLGVSGADFQRILRQPFIMQPPVVFPPGHGNEDAIWLYPALVCKIEYMEKSKTGSLRQPIFRGLRTDKKPEDCIERGYDK